LTAKERHMWGGRFEGAIDPDFFAFERSWQFDRRLLPYEIELDRAWAAGLERAALLESGESAKIVAALDSVERRAASQPAWLDASSAEDLHDFFEQTLVNELGSLGARLHTGRSRNEMIVTEFRMFVKDAAQETREAVFTLAAAIAGQAETNFGIPFPGMTHMQHAQPVLLSHWLLAHGEAFLRDAGRIAAAAESADACPLGSAALAGSAFPIDREILARDLGFSRITSNSLDAVGDRDFALEYGFALAALSLHLSRLAEDIILFATPEFGFVALPDAYSTGSSLMPQKKNPDAWELIRGKTGRIVGSLVSLMTTMKGLPSSYQRDLQEDKEPVFDAHDQALAMTRIAAGAIAATQFHEARLRHAAADPALIATEAADFLVLRGVPFRKAHEVVGKLVREAERRNRSLRDLPLEAFREQAPEFDAGVFASLSLEAALARRNVPGGTAPDAVRSALDEFHARLDRERAAQ
jgi:argininosuccinate lyase